MTEIVARVLVLFAAQVGIACSSGGGVYLWAGQCTVAALALAAAQQHSSFQTTRSIRLVFHAQQGTCVLITACNLHLPVLNDYLRFRVRGSKHTACLVIL